MAIALALASNPHLLMLDEPFSNPAGRIVKIKDGFTDFIGRPCDLLDVYRQEAKVAPKTSEEKELLHI